MCVSVCFCTLTLLTLDALLLCRALSITLLSVLFLPTPRSELWLVLSLICTLSTSNTTWSIFSPARRFVKRECVRKKKKSHKSTPQKTHTYMRAAIRQVPSREQLRCKRATHQPIWSNSLLFSLLFPKSKGG